MPEKKFTDFIRTFEPNQQADKKRANRKYLRKLQFDMWENVHYDPNVFVKPNIIFDIVIEYINKRKLKEINE